MLPRASNSYDFARFCAASAVLFSHHFALAGRPEPTVPGYGEDFGKLAVEVFFSLSGFLICLSLHKSVDWAGFASARFLRIFPNLTFALSITSAVTLFWFRNYTNFWPHAKYVLSNMLMFVRGVHYEIDGVFKDSVNSAVNGPLWSLPSEIWLYALLFLFAAVGRLYKGILILLSAIGLSILWGAAPAIGNVQIGPIDLFQFSRLGSFFFSGALLAVCWPYIGKHAVRIGVVAVFFVFLIRNSLTVDTLLLPLALAAAVVGLGSSGWMAWFSKGGDASYGMYIFAWPIQQFSLMLIGNFWLSMSVAFVVTTGLGYATWHSFERRAMTHRAYLAETLRKLARRFSACLPLSTDSVK